MNEIEEEEIIEEREILAVQPVEVRYVPRIEKEDADLILEFFMVFSRFEYALKQKKAYRSVRADQHVEPKWTEFAIAVKDKFNPDKTWKLREAFDYYLLHPPKIQAEIQGELGWKRNQKRPDETNFTWVIRSVKTVRNNLFHGGKFPWEPVRG